MNQQCDSCNRGGRTWELSDGRRMCRACLAVLAIQFHASNDPRIREINQLRAEAAFDQPPLGKTWGQLFVESETYRKMKEFGILGVGDA